MYDFVSYRFSALGLKQRPAIGQAAAVAFISLAIFVFTLYAPLAYGNAWTKDACNSVKLFDTWDWDCNTFHNSYDQYTTQTYPSISAVPSSKAPAVVPPPQQLPKQEAQNPAEPVGDAAVTSQAPFEVGENPIVSREEKIEYRDENGNLLDEEQVKALEGKVSFKTRYETRTRIIDSDGNEIYEGESAPDGRIMEGMPPPHPDVEGRNPETGDAGENEANDAPPTVAVGDDQAKENSAEGQAKGSPRPASEAQEATK